MREVVNRVNKVPVQEQEIINRFVTSAPKMPLARLGGGFMQECVNMSIDNDKLKLRKGMFNKKYFERSLFPAEMGISGYFHMFSIKDALFFVIISDNFTPGRIPAYVLGFYNHKFPESYNISGYGEVVFSGVIDYDNIEENPIKYITNFSFYGNLSILTYVKKDGIIKSLILNFDKEAYTYRIPIGISPDFHIRDKLGMQSPVVSKLDLYDAALPHYVSLVNNWQGNKFNVQMAIGIEYIVKDDAGNIVKSSGITRVLEANVLCYSYLSVYGLFAGVYIDNFIYDNRTSQPDNDVYVVVWASSYTNNFNTGYYAVPGLTLINGEGTLDTLYRIAELKYGDFDYSSGRQQTNIQGNYSFYLKQSSLFSEKYILAFGYGDSAWVNDIPTSVPDPDNPLQTIGRNYIKVFDPAGYALAVSPAGLGYNLVPMENALIFSGNRLWGIYEEFLTYSELAGVPEQEQRSPLAVLDLQLGRVKDIQSLNDNLFVFCEKGISFIANSNPEIMPLNLYAITIDKIHSFTVHGFGVFSVINDVLYFLDNNTRNFSKLCKGLDLNEYLGDLVTKIKRFAIFEEDIYFIAAERLFKLNFKNETGISEIVLKNSYKPNQWTTSPVEALIPLDINFVEGQDLVIQYFRPYSDNVELWTLRNIENEPTFNNHKESVHEMDCNATFALNAIHGFVEHWDTTVYSTLQSNAILETQDICDDVVYEASKANNIEVETAGKPWEYGIIAGKRNGIRRPIGKAIGIKLSVKHTAEVVEECEEVIYELKLTKISQNEVFRKGFNPNAQVELAAKSELSIFVIDAINKEPITNFMIVVDGLEHITTNGNIKLPLVNRGYQIEIFADYYNYKIIDVVLKRNKKIIVELDLFKVLLSEDGKFLLSESGALLLQEFQHG